MVEFNTLEKKWQKKWEESKVFHVTEDKDKKKYYVLEMYPYPSASFLHMGHVRNYTIGDVYARFKRMQGFNVLYPMGYDSFGLPAETAAKKEGIHPEKYTNEAIKKIMEYQKQLGNSYDWSRVISSHDPDYYKWNQYFFIKLFEKGLAYRKKAPVNWCPNCESVLANEEAEGGKCWRCDGEIIKKDLEQWFFKITAYADRLLEDLDKIDWPERIKVMQRNWIGRKEGYIQYYKVNDLDIMLSTFTTHHHTSFAEIFIAIAPEHPVINELVKGTKYEKGAKEFTDKVNKKKLTGKFTPESAKDGYFTGRYAKDFCSGRDLPIYIADFALMDFGTGIVKASCHDQRDFDFAKTHGIQMVEVLFPNKLIEKKKEKDIVEYVIIHPGLKEGAMSNYAYEGEYDEKEIGKASVKKNKELIELKLNINNDIPDKYIQEGAVIRQGIYHFFYEDKFQKIRVNPENLSLNMQDMEDMGFSWSNGGYELSKGAEKVPYSYDGQGYFIRSNQFSSMSVPEAKRAMGEWMIKNKYADKTITYSIRDWLISRQRYWGTPIPMIHCEKCGVVPVPENDLPVLLPENVDFKSANALASNKEFLNVKCPKCHGNAKRETDTMGGFVDSSWYFLRYCDPHNKKEAFSKEKVKYWMPVDQYVGGAEHAVMHLMYARFFVKALQDLGYVDFSEPFAKLFNQGIVYKDGAKMSKSKGNVVYQTDISNKYGIDTARLFLMFVAAPDKVIEWSDEGIEGSFRLIKKFFSLLEKRITDKHDAKQESKINKTIKNVTENLVEFKFNIAIIHMQEMVNYLHTKEEINKKVLMDLVKLMSPFTPHVCEEMWEQLGGKGFVSVADWPKFDQSKINESAEMEEEIVANTVADIRNVLGLIKLEKPKKIKLIVAPKWKYDLFSMLKKEIEVTRDIKVLMGKAMADPELKKYGQDITKIIPAVLKEPAKMPKVVLGQDKDYENLKHNIPEIKKAFDCEVLVEKAEESKEKKAMNGVPGKAAIVVE